MVRNVFFALIAAQMLSSVFEGHVLSVNVVAPSILAVAVIEAFPALDGRQVLRLAYRASMLPVLASLVAWLLGYSWAVVGPDRRLPFPFIDGRLTGVLPHPNALGPIAALSLILCLAYRPRWTLFWFVISGVVLWGSDSRTPIVLAPLGLLIVLLERHRLSPLLRNACLLFGSTLILFALNSSGLISSAVGSDNAQTLDGRTRLWTVATRYWQSSPIVGVGPAAFDRAFRETSGLSFAGQAHNQFFQTLASEGLVGVVLLLVFVVVVIQLCVANRTVTAGASVAAGLILFGEMMVESPLKVGRWSPSLLVLSIVLALGFAGRARPVTEERRGLDQQLRTDG